MPTAEFLDRIVSRLDRIDRKSLEGYIQNLMEEKQLFMNLLNQIPQGIMLITTKKELLFLNRRMMHLLNLPDSVKMKSGVKEAIHDVSLREWVLSVMDRKEEKFNEEIELLLPRPMTLQVSLIYEEYSWQFILAHPLPIILKLNHTQFFFNLSCDLKIAALFH